MSKKIQSKTLRLATCAILVLTCSQCEFLFLPGYSLGPDRFRRKHIATVEVYSNQKIDIPYKLFTREGGKLQSIEFLSYGPLRCEFSISNTWNAPIDVAVLPVHHDKTEPVKIMPGKCRLLRGGELINAIEITSPISGAPTGIISIKIHRVDYENDSLHVSVSTGRGGM